MDANSVHLLDSSKSDVKKVFELAAVIYKYFYDS